MNGATRAAYRRHYDLAVTLADERLAADLRAMALDPRGTPPSKRMALVMAAAERISPLGGLHVSLAMASDR